MEDFQLDVVLGQGPSARDPAPRPAPLHPDRRHDAHGPPDDAPARPLRLLHRLDYYGADDLGAIVRRSARLLGVGIDEDGSSALAARSRGTPRIANRLLRRVRDVAQVRGRPRIDRAVAEEALELLEVDELGLDELDRQLLRRLAQTFEGRPVGLGTLADSVGESPDTIEDVYEPYLLQEGLLKRTPRGRVATPRAYRHLGLAPPAEIGHPELF